MNFALVGVAALVAVCIVLLIGRASRRKSVPITHAELVKRVKRLP